MYFVFGVLLKTVNGFEGDTMGFRRFEDLDIFRLAETMADDIWQIVCTWKYFEKDTVGKQLVSSADSIGANIAEGAGRGTPKDNKRFVRIARGSLNETKFWIRRADERKLLKVAQAQQLKALLDELAPRLNAYLKSIK